MKKPVVLRVLKGDQLQGVKQFTDSQIVIGRPGDVQLELDGSGVSLIHTLIEERGGTYFVCDLGSESGTFKNGESVLDAALESGDTIQIGEFKVEFYIGVPRPKTQSAPPPAQPVRVEPKTEVKVDVKPTFKPEPKPEPKVEAPKPKVSPTFAPSAPSPSPTQTMGSPAVSLGGLSTTPVVKAKSGIGLRGPGTDAPRRGTFAPASPHQDVKEFIKPSKGTVVEVLVAWKERVISTSHFTERRVVTIGSKSDCDIVLPIFASKARKVPLLKIENRAVIMLKADMNGDIVRGQSTTTFAEIFRQGRLQKATGAFYGLPLEQGEMVHIEISDQISIIVRYVSDSPKPLVAPLLDFTTSEATGVVLSFAVVAIIWLYTFLYAPRTVLNDDMSNEPKRTAVIILPPEMKPKVVAAPKVEEEKPVPTPPPVVTKPVPTVVKVAETTKAPQKKASTNLTTKNDNGKSANAAPNKNKTGPRQLTSPKQGGSIKTADKEGSQMQSKPQKDMSHVGVFSVFGGGGANDKLAQTTTGSGELAGLAANAGRSGMGENRAGQGLGSAVKDTGVGGTGKALTGIAGGVGTQGRGSGNSGYGTGGLGNHQGVSISAGGNEEVIQGTIDREAIRRVILANTKVIKTCYERQLERHPDLFGKLVLSWEIGDAGRVLSVKTKTNELGSQDVAQCVMDHLKTWKFPEPPANQIVEVEAYPFFFSN